MAIVQRLTYFSRRIGSGSSLTRRFWRWIRVEMQTVPALCFTCWSGEKCNL